MKGKHRIMASETSLIISASADTSSAAKGGDILSKSSNPSIKNANPSFYE